MNCNGFSPISQASRLDSIKIELYLSAGIANMKEAQVLSCMAFTNNLLYWVAKHEGIIEEELDQEGGIIRTFVSSLRSKFLRKSRKGLLNLQLFMEGLKQYACAYWKEANSSRKCFRHIRDMFAQLGILSFNPVLPGTTRQAPVLEGIDIEKVIIFHELCEHELMENREYELSDIGRYDANGVEYSHSGATVSLLAHCLGYNYHPRKEGEKACNFPEVLEPEILEESTEIEGSKPLATKDCSGKILVELLAPKLTPEEVREPKTTPAGSDQSYDNDIPSKIPWGAIAADRTVVTLKQQEVSTLW